MNDSSGQTLIEAVIVIVIALVLSVGLLVGATVSLKASRYSKAKTLSVRYAQEGIETARAIRNASWTALFSCATPSLSQWYLNSPVSIPATITQCSDVMCAASSGLCQMNNIPNGNFSRSLTFTQINAGTAVSVVSKVSWTEGASTYATTLSTALTQWR